MIFSLLLSCFGSADVEPKAEALPQVHHDMESLRRYFEPPPALGEVAWAVAPLGTGELGPTDLRMVLWFPHVPEERRKVILTVPRNAPLPTDALAKLVLPPETGNPLGYEASAFGNIFWHGGGAWQLGEGVFVEVFNR